MAQLKFGSAGVTAREIDISGPTTQQPVGIPAGIVGTSLKGPAFVPITVGTLSDWYAKFGTTDGKKFGPLAVVEWLRNARSVTYLKVLGAGDGRKRDVEAGKVTSAGFVVGENLPYTLGDGVVDDGALTSNPYAVVGGDEGRLFFLGCLMSESLGSTFFSEAGLQGAGSVTPGSNTALPIIRGVLMAPSGVFLTLSASVAGITSTAPTSTTVGRPATSLGSALGSVVLSANGTPKQEVTLYLNGHKGTDSRYPNTLTVSFDPTSNNYFGKALNTDPAKIQEAGHYLYANWEVHSSLAVVTGSGIVAALLGAGAPGNASSEPSAFLVTSALSRNVGSSTVPNYESFEDRFSHATSPWLISQKFGGQAQDLFRLHALDDGAGNSTRFKVSIENLTPSTDPLNKYGSFTVVLREWTDRDQDKKNLPNEVYAGVNLDPSSDRYIAKVIGDVHAYFDFDREESQQKLVVEGNYENKSNFVRVEVHPDIENGFVDPVAMPMGFRGVSHLLTSGSSPLQSFSVSANVALDFDNFAKRAITPPLPFRRKVTSAEEWTAKEQVNSKFYWGVQFEHPESLTKKNGSILPNGSLKSFAKYFPDFAVGDASFLVGNNTGAVDTAALGIVDADKFCNNLFTLENLQVVTGSNGLADPNKWVKAVYARRGNPGSVNLTELGTDSDKVRAFKVEDINSNKQFAKFSFIMQGGFDGVNIFDANESAINNTAVSADMNPVAGRGLENGPNVRTYLKAIEVMKNTVNVDIQLFAIPGLREPIITDAATLAVEERFDAMYVMDIEQLDENGSMVTSDTQLPSVIKSVDNFVNRSVDSSFAAAYFPDVLYRDPTGINMHVPPSVLVLGALSLNDSVGHPWFAPAGFTRGALPTVALEPRVRLGQSDMDSLYNVSINPIVAFPGAVTSGTNPRGGIVVWGQKTLQVAASALDRVNVRRLLIDIRRQVRDIAQTILFEPNREATLARFSAAVTPRLQRIQALSGLERFKVVIDSSTTTQDDIQNNTIRGKIFVQPTKSIEFVSLDFVVANNLAQVQ
jgi:phage tail sheath protein FI